MAWSRQKVEEQRKDLIQAYLKDNESMEEICRRFGISRKTGYKWCNRYKELGEKGLVDLSNKPKDPYRVYPKEIIDIAIDLKLKKRKWGPRKILVILKRTYPRIDWPCPTRLYEIFKANSLIFPRRLRGRVPATHPLRECNGANETWMADFKGGFLTGDNRKCEPLTITDGHTRYLIKCVHAEYKSCEHIWPIFKDAFLEYGIPNRLRTDNGSPFGTIGAGRLSHLSINLIKAGVTPEWINPGHPEENGRHERFHGTLKEAVAAPPAATLEEQIRRMAIFQEEYNFERPHEALNMDSPAQHYSKSSRTWDGILRAPEYDSREMLVRKVCQSGCIWIKQTEHYISQTLSGEYVGIKEDEEGHKVQYGPVHLGRLCEGRKRIEKPKLINKPITRR